jgi:hypothetical protein
MLHWVVLQHSLPDGTSHYDWLIEPAAGAALLSLRVPVPLQLGTHLCERQPDHRRIYLTYEGPLTNNRGSVTRIQQGTVHHIAHTASTLDAVLIADNATYRIAATATSVVVSASPTKNA